MRAGLVSFCGARRAAGLGERGQGRGWGDLGGRADTYSSLVEVLLYSEAAHPAVAVRPSAAQHSQQHKRPHPLHLVQESALWEKHDVTTRLRSHSDRYGPTAPPGSRESPKWYHPETRADLKGATRRAGSRGGERAAGASPPLYSSGGRGSRCCNGAE